MIAQFIPTETFQAEVNGCVNTYLEGQTYHVREHNVNLLDLARGWEEEGLVDLFLPQELKPGGRSGVGAKTAEASGTGRVS